MCALLVLLVAPGSASAQSIAFNDIGCSQPSPASHSPRSLVAIANDTAHDQAVLFVEYADSTQLPILVSPPELSGAPSTSRKSEGVSCANIDPGC
jgi:hypothetical protein